MFVFRSSRCLQIAAVAATLTPVHCFDTRFTTHTIALCVVPIITVLLLVIMWKCISHMKARQTAKYVAASRCTSPVSEIVIHESPCDPPVFVLSLSDYLDPPPAYQQEEPPPPYSSLVFEPSMLCGSNDDFKPEILKIAI